MGTETKNWTIETELTPGSILICEPSNDPTGPNVCMVAEVWSMDHAKLFKASPEMKTLLERTLKMLIDTDNFDEMNLATDIELLLFELKQD